MKISLLNIVEDTTVDGPGFRTAVYCAGCAKLYGLTVHGDRQTIFPLAVLVEKVDSGALCAELTLVQHEYTIGILLLLRQIQDYLHG